ncbi:ubiquinol-cytochrome c reductase cytochrome c1 subunit [Vreelandella songnenensis]|uniref:Ubiquinol-cytochrome c reductase cytochrome c1 subunit n=1 Tax=Vreelandella songnenensis TaxID=1176243 RepID=A0A2T0V7H2_9GAMM|nr:cytochrome c1 [Halomonas songnenensis]PRY66126.1 ubiquinol-cytochrome c reductase cytochrome c1 subunit [Halomonas songnenensis]
MKRWMLVLWLLLMPLVALGSDARSVSPDLNDKASLQRGLKFYVNYCLGCHTLEYQRYSRTAADLDIPQALMEEHLVFSSAQAFDDPMVNALKEEEAQQWWGVRPPDLTLATKHRGVDWVYAYLLGFYEDPSRPLGVNNILVESVAMPNVLEPLQGVQVMGCPQGASRVLSRPEECRELALARPGLLSPAEFEQAVFDITNFLAYVSEPSRLKAQGVAPGVMIFVFVFGVMAYLLKREYWRDVR